MELFIIGLVAQLNKLLMTPSGINRKLIMRSLSVITLVAALGLSLSCGSPEVSASKQIVHDAEFYILSAQHGEKWAAEDAELGKKLAELRARYGRPPNIIHIMWDDTAFGDVGIPAIQKVRGLETPNMNQMAD